VKFDRLGRNLHTGDHVRVSASPKRLRSVNLHTHSCREDRVEQVRPHPSPSGETSVKITCGYVVPISMIKFLRCPHVWKVPAVHAYTGGTIPCGVVISVGTRFAVSPDRWTCKTCIRITEKKR
jgi:hypothetical protein